MGKQRLGVNLVSLIAALREEARLPLRTIKWYLETVHGLRLSTGAIVDATQRVARKAQAVMAGILERIPGSPVVHADETGWREDGHNGYVWTFSTPTQRYFLRRGRGKAVVDEVLGDQFAGVLVSDFYAAYHHYDGPKQRCWAHLLRDIHHLRALYPEDDRLAQWADAVHQLYCQAKAYTRPQAKQRRTAQLALERQLLVIGQPFLHDTSATPAKLCRRIERHIAGLEKRIAQSEGQAKSGGSRGMPGLKPKADGKPAQPRKPRKSRPHGFARARMTPTHQVEHVVVDCPDCGTPLSGGWIQRTREVIDLPQVPVQVTEHAYIARTCPQC